MCGSCPRMCGLNPRLIYLQRVSNNSFLKLLNYLKDIFHETMAVLPSGGVGGGGGLAGFHACENVLA